MTKADKQVVQPVVAGKAFEAVVDRLGDRAGDFSVFLDRAKEIGVEEGPFGFPNAGLDSIYKANHVRGDSGTLVNRMPFTREMSEKLEQFMAEHDIAGKPNLALRMIAYAFLLMWEPSANFAEEKES